MRIVNEQHVCRVPLVDLADGEVMRLSSSTKARRLKISAVVND